MELGDKIVNIVSLAVWMKVFVWPSFKMYSGSP